MLMMMMMNTYTYRVTYKSGYIYDTLLLLLAARKAKITSWGFYPTMFKLTPVKEGSGFELYLDISSKNTLTLHSRIQ